MTRTFDFSNLPHGSGAAVGNFIRSVYMTSSKRPAIVGIAVNNLGFFEHIPQSTTMVSDIVCGIISEEYSINPIILTDDRIAGTSDLGDVWAVSVQIPDTTELRTEHFKNVFITKSRTLATFAQPQNITVTFYIMNVCGVMKETLASACLQEALGDKHNVVAPLSCMGQRTMKCWHTIQKNKFTEDVTVHLEAPDNIFDDDFNHLKDILAGYLTLILNVMLESK